MERWQSDQRSILSWVIEVKYIPFLQWRGEGYNWQEFNYSQMVSSKILTGLNPVF